jgi:CheY-like chemotaxis protein
VISEASESELARTVSSPGSGRGPGPRRVLIVDDNVDSCETLEAVLDDLGHETRVAHDGPGALEIVDGFAPDIVLLDISLPGMDGFEIVRRMRRLDAGAKIPIVALSGYATSADRARALEAGYSEHLAKPLDLAVLERVVAQSG